MAWGRHCVCGDGCRRSVRARESDDAGPSRSAGTGEILGGVRVVRCEPPLTGAGSIVGSIEALSQPVRARTPRRDRRDLGVPALPRGRAGPVQRRTARRDRARWRVSARFMCGSARRLGSVSLMTETASQGSVFRRGLAAAGAATLPTSIVASRKHPLIGRPRACSMSIGRAHSRIVPLRFTVSSARRRRRWPWPPDAHALAASERGGRPRASRARRG